MNWNKLLDQGIVQPVKFSKTTEDDLLKLVERDILDAQVEELSPDRKFAIAYSAALNLARVAVFKAGYRIRAKAGHHRASFDAAEVAIGNQVKPLCDYFDYARKQRNKVDYDFVEVVSEDEMNELMQNVFEFKKVVLDFLSRK